MEQSKGFVMEKWCVVFASGQPNEIVLVSNVKKGAQALLDNFRETWGMLGYANYFSLRLQTEEIEDVASISDEVELLPVEGDREDDRRRTVGRNRRRPRAKKVSSNVSGKRSARPTRRVSA